jgi:hypothetical protein
LFPEIKNHTSTKRLRNVPKRNDKPKKNWSISRKNNPANAIIARTIILIGKEARDTVNITMIFDVRAFRAINIHTKEKNMPMIVPTK